ncbi:MAG: hypothetical protein CR977_02310 [Gammaproteobacteria bacterium]|nr:MAG: hypothetical protein CR977_02310 [Gammaproteobacteria bacterium]
MASPCCRRFSSASFLAISAADKRLGLLAVVLVATGRSAFGCLMTFFLLRTSMATLSLPTLMVLFFFRAIRLRGVSLLPWRVRK